MKTAELPLITFNYWWCKKMYLHISWNPPPNIIRANKHCVYQLQLWYVLHRYMSIWYLKYISYIEIVLGTYLIHLIPDMSFKRVMISRYMITLSISIQSSSDRILIICLWLWLSLTIYIILCKYRIVLGGLFTKLCA